MSVATTREDWDIAALDDNLVPAAFFQHHVIAHLEQFLHALPALSRVFDRTPFEAILPTRIGNPDCFAIIKEFRNFSLYVTAPLRTQKQYLYLAHVFSSLSLMRGFNTSEHSLLMLPHRTLLRLEVCV